MVKPRKQLLAGCIQGLIITWLILDLFEVIMQSVGALIIMLFRNSWTLAFYLVRRVQYDGNIIGSKAGVVGLILLLGSH